MSFLNTHQLISYIKYYTAAKTIHSAHSPFLYDFLLNTIENRRRYYAFNDFDHLRRLMALNKEKIGLTDYGAGSHTLTEEKRRISDILQTSVSGENQCRVLFNIARFMQAKHILELGSSLGISTLYLSQGHPTAKVYTIEGDPEIHHIARANYDLFHPEIVSMCGKFDAILPELLPRIPPIDLVFIDGNHRYDATLNYHTMIKKWVSSRAVLVYDDIYWSTEMTRAWQELIQDDHFQISIDCFHYGILIKHPEASKEHFTIIEKRKKPWSLGFNG